MYTVKIKLKYGLEDSIEVICDDAYFKKDILMVTYMGTSLFMIPRENILYVKTKQGDRR